MLTLDVVPCNKIRFPSDPFSVRVLALAAVNRLFIWAEHLSCLVTESLEEAGPDAWKKWEMCGVPIMHSL